MIRAPEKLPGLHPDAARVLLEVIRGLTDEVNRLAAASPLTGLQRAGYVARAGETVRMRGGERLTLPRARTENAGAEVHVILETEGRLEVVAHQGQVDGLDLEELETIGLYTFRSNGVSGWFCNNSELRGRFIVGDPGTEDGGITIQGSTFDSLLKVSDIGSGNEAMFILHRHATAQGPVFITARSNSDTAAHGTVTNGQDLGTWYAVGWDGTDYAYGGYLAFLVDGTPGSNDMPTRFVVATTADGAGSAVERLRINSTRASFAVPIARTGVETNSSTGALGTVAIGDGTSVFRWGGGAGDATIAGFSGTLYDGRELWVENIDGTSGDVLTLLPDQASTATDGFHLGGIGASSDNSRKIVIPNRGATLLRYDVTSERWYAAITHSPPNAVQRYTTGGLSTDLVINDDTRTLEIDCGNTAWSIDSITGGYAGRKLTIRNSSNAASTGTLITSGSSAGTAGNLIVTPGDVNRGGYSRYSAELEYDGTDSIWRIVADTGAISAAPIEIRYLSTADAAITESVPVGCTWFKVFAKAGGSGGGGADSDTNLEVTAGGGGGEGCEMELWIPVSSGNITGAVGAGGAGGSNAGGNGTTGGGTTFTYNGSSYLCNQGGIGIGTAAGIVGAGGSATRGGNGAGGSLTVGSEISIFSRFIFGAPGEPGIMLGAAAITAEAAIGGNGGGQGGGRGGQQVGAAGASNGADASSPGCGGGGGARLTAGANTGATGGAGTDGYMRLEFYSGPVPTFAAIN